MASAPKIPDMFLKALKRKQSSTVVGAVAGSINKKLEGEEKRPKKEQENETPVEEDESRSAVEPAAAASPSTSAPAAAQKPVASSAAAAATEAPAAVAKTADSAPIDLYSLIRDAGWRSALEDEFKKPYVGKIEAELEKERKANKTVYPPRDEIFAALNITPLSDVRVVLIGQDPYHNVDQAHGLCFSVKRGVKPPPSLKNIYKELTTDVEGFKTPDHGFLESWARQGILMLNAALTVRAHEANSHSKFGWYTLTDRIISIVSKEREGVVFLLWGGFAHKKEALVDRKKHTIVKTAHPSPLSARHFMGCGCFSKVNEHLKEYGKEPINWGDL